MAAKLEVRGTYRGGFQKLAADEADEEERRCCLCMCGAGEHNTRDASFPKHIMSEGGKLLHPTLP